MSEPIKTGLTTNQSGTPAIEAILGMVSVAHISSGRAVREPQTVERPWTTNPNDLISYAEIGRTCIRLEGRPEPIWLEEGTCVYLPANRRRQATMYPREGSSIRHYLQFSVELPSRLRLLSYFEPPSLYTGAAAERLLHSIRGFYEHAAGDGPRELTAALELRACGARILTELLRHATPQAAWQGLLQHVERLQPVMAYMDANWRRDLSLEELAAAAHTSVPTLCRLFRQTLDQSPQDYLRELRMRQARRLLLTTHASLAEIAAELGYADAFTFSRAFKRVCGQAPSDFRAASPDVL